MMKYYIRSFSFSQSEIARKLSAPMKIIIEHLLYIVLAPESTTVHHWCSEIYGFLNYVGKLDRKNRFPKQRQIYEWTYGKMQDLVTDERFMSVMIKSAVRKERFTVDVPINEIITKLDHVCTDYFSWLSQELSTVGIVDSDDVESKIRDMVAKY